MATHNNITLMTTATTTTTSTTTTMMFAVTLRTYILHNAWKDIDMRVQLSCQSIWSNRTLWTAWHIGSTRIYPLNCFLSRYYFIRDWCIKSVCAFVLMEMFQDFFGTETFISILRFCSILSLEVMSNIMVTSHVCILFRKIGADFN